MEKAAENLGIGRTTLGAWTKAAKENDVSVPTRGSGNFESDEAKEIARLKKNSEIQRMLWTYKKKQSAFWETDTGIFYRNSKCRRKCQNPGTSVQC